MKFLWQNFLPALGLKGGAVKCQEVAKKFETLQNVLNMKPNDLMAEKGMGGKIGRRFLSSLQNKKKIIQNLLNFVKVIHDHSNEK